MIDRLPATMLMMFAGTKNGEILRGPRQIGASNHFSMPVTPPIPEPIATPMRLAFCSVISIRCPLAPGRRRQSVMDKRIHLAGFFFGTSIAPRRSPKSARQSAQ